MKVSGTYIFDGTREEVWDILTDINVLRRAIPGCQRLEPIGDDTYAADLKLGLAGIRGDYSGTVRLSDQQPPSHYRMDVQGKGANGFVQGAGVVDLEQQPDGKTLIRYSGDAQIGGAIAGIGQRLLDGAARTVINQSLKALSAELAARKTSAVEQQVAVPPSAPEAPQPSPTSPPSPPVQPAAPEQPGLTTGDVLRGAAEDVLAARPYLRWAIPAAFGFLLGLLIGRASR
ncbi:MAG: carbon monoxide dehydrogenase subunit G [Herpetosiphonaceae bacterium]|nr:MAG: carbon monoxide dehydrogenase subunit G [Herpetosiphonaceae bacterium]